MSADSDFSTRTKIVAIPKRFHFATIHLVMIGLILFGIATIFVRVLKSESALIFEIGRASCRERV